MAELHVKGLAALQRMLDELPPKLEGNIMRGALRAGMKIVKPVAASNVRSVSGELAAGLKISTRRRRGRVTASLKTKGDHGFVGRMVEFGTKAHFISVQASERGINRRTGQIVSMRTVNRNVLRIGANFVGPTVHHPGARPRPFLRPALDGQAGAAIVEMAEYIKRRLTKEGLDTSEIMIIGEDE